MLRQLKEELSKNPLGIQGQENYFCSAVLLPLIETDQGLSIILEVRSNQLRRQPGEVCFPGGKIERDEFDKPEKTALRETWEEINIPAQEIDLLGPLDILVTPNGVIVYPFVGLLKSYSLDNFSPAEVERLICLPLKFFLDNPPQKSNLEYKLKPSQGFPLDLVPSSYREKWKENTFFYPVYFYQLPDGSVLWGITALILFNFLQVYRKFV